MLVLGIFCAELLVCVLMGISIVYALLIGLVLFVAYGKRRGFTWRELGGMIASGVKTARSVMTVLLMIGVLTGLWRACGTLPLIICYAVDLLRPETLLLTAFLLNCGISLLIGTSFGTAATMGSICMTVALSMGMDPAMVGGAILAGAYFGDRCSPVSTSALLVSELTKTDIYDNIRRMVRTAAVPFLLTCGIYGALGLCFGGGGETADLRQIFGRTAVLHMSALIPALLVLALAALRVKVKKAICASIAAALVLCVLLQRLPLWDILRFAVSGYTARDAEAAALLDGGGMLSMLRVCVIICVSSAYAGIFQKTGLLDRLQEQVRRLSRRATPFAAMLCTAALTSLIACNQTLTIMLTHQVCDGTMDKPEDAAIGLEDTAVVVAPLVPWSIASAAALAAAGAPTRSILFACFLYLLPLWSLLRSLRTEKRRARA